MSSPSQLTKSNSSSGPTMLITELASFNEDQQFEINEQNLLKLGGLKELEKKLQTNFTRGLTSDPAMLELRRKLYGRNEFPEPESETWFQMFFESFQDTTMIVLIVSAAVSFIVGMIEDPKKGWIEAVAIFSATQIVGVVTATNNYNKELQFRKLNAVKDNINVGVMRDGVATTINTKELVVGDVVILNAGDKVPSDGLLITGSDVSCNESALTGESDDKKKNPQSGDIFFISGSTVSTGYCLMLVTAVGEESRWGKTKAKLSAKTVNTPLQDKLDVLAGQIGNLGMLSAVATFFAMIAVWYLNPASRDSGENIFDHLLKSFIMAVTIVVVAVPEGLPLAVTLSLAYSTQKMMLDNNLIRVLAACETMGNATNICSDKTGTLTQNRMTVVQAWAAGKCFNDAPTPEDLSLPLTHSLVEGISVNSTANIMYSSVPGVLPVVNGNKTEGALLMMLKSQFKQDYRPMRNNFNAARGDLLITFSSSRKRMSVVLRNKGKAGVSYTKGAAEIILENSSKYIDQNGNIQKLDQATRMAAMAAIEKMAKSALRTIGVAHNDFDNFDDFADPEDFEKNLTLNAIFGIKDPLRVDVTDAVRACQDAGIFVRMVTGDNIETAKAIALECGILTPGGVAMEGPTFRKLTPKQLDETLPLLQVLARSSPDDKHTLVTRLNGQALPENKEDWLAQHPGRSWESERELLLPGYLEEWKANRKNGVGEVVGVTGDGTNDGPALKAADVGLSMGLSGTDVAKEASDIVILDDNFSSIVKSVVWGRAVFDNIRKFLQFQLTVNVVALTLTFLSAVTGYHPPLNAVMMLWVNLIMDTMGALALGTESPSSTLLLRRPYKRDASLISNKMLRNIIVQFIFQLGLLSFLLLLGSDVFGTTEGSIEHITIIFNTFVFCQVFNELNARSIGDDFDVFKGLDKNVLFVIIILFTVVMQYLIVEFGGDFVRTQSLTRDQWFKCVLLGSLSLPIGGLMRLIPIQDSEDDFAEVSPLITTSNKNRKNIVEKKSSDSQFSFSFILWILAVTLIPIFTYQEFEKDLKIYAEIIFKRMY